MVSMQLQPVLSALVLTVAVGASPAAAGGPAMSSDFNGDGFADLAIGAEGDGVGGSVTVLYGSAAGTSTAGAQHWSQATRGVKGSPDLGRGNPEYFGSGLASGDFDGDGFADLATAVVFDDVAGVEDAGAVNVLYGSPRGLTASGDQRWSRANLPGSQGPTGSMAAGDFDQDGFSDLVFGIQFDDGEPRLVQVLFGTPDGLSAERATRLARTDTWPADPEEVFFAASLAAGDLNGDRFIDLAVGSPGEGCGSDDCIYGGGEVGVFFGGSGGIAASGQRWDQDSPGILDDDEPGDAFGSGLAVGDFDGDGFGDLAVGAAGEIVGFDDESSGEGAVSVLYGSAAGLTDEGNQFWHQNVAGVPGQAAPYDEFATVAAGDLNGDGRDDLAIGANGDNAGGEPAPGSVTVLYGTPGGLDVAGVQRWTEATPGVGGEPIPGERFGDVLAIGTFGKTMPADLAIGSPREYVGGVMGGGSVTVLYGRRGGFASRGSSLWTQATPGVPGTPGRHDEFGGALTP